MPKTIQYPLTYLLFLCCGLCLLFDQQFQPPQVIFLLTSLIWLAPLFL